MTLDAAIARLLSRIVPPDEVAMEVEVALRMGACRGSDVTTQDVARRTGANYWTLTKRLRARGLPSLRNLIAWGRILDAMLAWTDGRTLDDVAWAKGWKSGSEISQMLHRHTGLYPTEWSGDIDELVEVLCGPAKEAA